jgi:hypothetical protein
MPFSRQALNPDAETVISYAPGWIAVIVKYPESLVTEVLTSPEDTFRIVTVALGTTAPETSYTVPLRVPVNC